MVLERFPRVYVYYIIIRSFSVQAQKAHLFIFLRYFHPTNNQSPIDRSFCEYQRQFPVVSKTRGFVLLCSLIKLIFKIKLYGRKRRTRAGPNHELIKRRELKQSDRPLAHSISLRRRKQIYMERMEKLGFPGKAASTMVQFKVSHPPPFSGEH